MRIWDLNPGYLNDRSLLGEHRELHAIYVILTQNRVGYSKHPETIRWKGFLGALVKRHQLLCAEMGLRGMKHHSPLEFPPGSIVWPSNFVNTPAEQIEILRQKYEHKLEGRIPLPKSTQQLWAQHKYSVMARNPQLYQEIGAQVATLKKFKSFEEISLQLTLILRETPKTGTLHNAVQHMWGYVSKLSNPDDETFQSSSTLLHQIQKLARTHKVEYIMESTALSELTVFL